MNIYMTVGTLDFLQKIQSKYSKEKMTAMLGTDGALLLHETEGKTVFAAPRKYEVIESIGDISNEGLVVMNNTAVTDEGRPVFEHQLKNIVHKTENAEGFIALRFLRPRASKSYIVMTIWKNKTSYENWRNTPSSWETYLKNLGNHGINIFNSSPYTSLYMITT